jgi:amino acid permease
MVEICIIGYLMGCAVAFFVVIGDLMPQILGNTFGFDSSPLWIRNLAMISMFLSYTFFHSL